MYVSTFSHLMCMGGIGPRCDRFEAPAIHSSTARTRSSTPHCSLEKQRLFMSDTNKQDAWDDISVNPHQTEIDLGRAEGQIAGLQAGFNDGFALGRTKGIEFGMELGFVRGFLNTVEAKNERLQKKVEELRHAIDDFPSLDAIKTVKKEEETYSEEDDSEAVVMAGNLDILGSMQRIRAKFKVLTVQLKVSQFSLKQVMDDANRMGSEETHIRHNNVDVSQGMSSEW